MKRKLSTMRGRLVSAVTNTRGNEALGYIIVALVTVLIGAAVYGIFKTQIDGVLQSMFDKIKTAFELN